MLPCVRRLRASDLPLRLSPLALVHVTEGELVLRTSGEAHRLLTGELLALRDADPAELAAPRGSAEALILHATPLWVARARALFQSCEPPQPRDALVRERAGSETARRAGRLLLAAYLETGDESGAGSLPGALGTEGAGRMIELVGIAHGMSGSLVAPRPQGARGRPLRAPLARALAELESAPLEGFSLGILARRLGVSERHASRLLREELGSSLPEYLAALRIERAKKRLATTQESITDVALETGWQSLSHFNAVFRRRAGVTPSAYRALAGAAPVL
jgi:AraC-like DNA-binding protein